MQSLLRNTLPMRCFPLLLVVLLAAPVAADDTDVAISMVLKSSGLSPQLEQLSQAILSAVPEDAFPDKKSRSAAAAFVKLQASTDALEASVHAIVRESLDAAALDKINQFLDSPAGKKVSRAQYTALDASVLKRIREGRSLVPSLSDKRTDLLKRIVTAQQVAERNAQLLASVIKGLADGSQTGKRESGQSKEVTRKINLIEKEITAESQSTQEIALLSSAHLYRSLDDKELEDYALFEESGPAARFREALARGLDQAVFQCAKALGEYFAKPQSEQPRKSQRAPTAPKRSKEPESDYLSPLDRESQ